MPDTDFVHCVFCGHDCLPVEDETHEPWCPEVTGVGEATRREVDAGFTCSGTDGCGRSFEVGDAMHWRQEGTMPSLITGERIQAVLAICTGCALKAVA